MTVWQTAFYSVTALSALFAALSWCLSAGTVGSVVALVVMAIVWPLANGPLEGHVLVTLNREDGVTTSDLLSVLALLVAIRQGWKLRARPPRDAAPPSEKTSPVGRSADEGAEQPPSP